MFTNKKINDYTHATRYVASWINVGGQLRTDKDIRNFVNWLTSLGLSNEDIRLIKKLATCGKLELEDHAKKFIAEHCTRK